MVLVAEPVSQQYVIPTTVNSLQMSGGQMSVGVEAELDAVGVTSSVPASELTTLVTSSPQFVQPAGAEEDLIHMSSLSGSWLQLDCVERITLMVISRKTRTHTHTEKGTSKTHLCAVALEKSHVFLGPGNVVGNCYNFCFWQRHWFTCRSYADVRQWGPCRPILWYRDWEDTDFSRIWCSCGLAILLTTDTSAFLSVQYDFSTTTWWSQVTKSGAHSVPVHSRRDLYLKPAWVGHRGGNHSMCVYTNSTMEVHEYHCTTATRMHRGA